METIEIIEFAEFIAICHTENCENCDIPINVIAVKNDPYVVCGVCEQQITDLTPAKTPKAKAAE